MEKGQFVTLKYFLHFFLNQFVMLWEYCAELFQNIISLVFKVGVDAVHTLPS